MTEIVARLPRAAASVLLLVAVGLVVLQPPARAAARHAVKTQRFLDPAISAALAADAARGSDRGFFTSSPGGIFATAARVAQWRPLVTRAARRGGLDVSMLEALVFVESSGRAGAVGSSRVGLTQVTPWAARHAHLRVREAKAQRLTRRIDAAERRGRSLTVRQLRRWRARFDQRFAPARALRATVSYLTLARHRLGRADLALAAYHVGIGDLRRAVRAYGGEGVPSYAQLYFGSAPDRRRGVWLRLHGGGEYYWKLLAARRVMRLYRHDPAALAYESRLQAQKSSAEEVMHPRSRTPRFASPRAIARAWKHHVLRAIPRDVARTHIAIGPFVGQEARKLGRSRRLYTGLRPATLDVLLYIGERVHQLSGARKLLVTSAVRDNRYQRVLMRVNANAARTYSIHTTGYAFDIARSYSSGKQAEAFQFVLDRLSAIGAIAYIREAAAIHVAVASDASQKLRLLARA